MKKLIMPFAVIAAVGIYAGTASAQCTFGFDGGTPENSRGPAPAKGVKGSMVRNYAACTSTEHPTANATTESGTDACQPVTPPVLGGGGTTYAYSAKGKCTASTQAKLLKDCSKAEDSAGNPLGLEARPCHVTFVRSSCKGIVKADGTTPINGAVDDGWELATLSRASLNDPTGGDMTVIDFPVAFTYSTPEDGEMEIDSSSAEALLPLVGANGAALPACTSIEIVDVKIKDPDGNSFAKLGGATSPK
ncbi:MAG TPA: hypothetical protein VN634_17160 [Candidatus Limnocylindrales bacterium]|nr:hypothetical protein [Candidatus Limnocylindrales bacterium]